MTGPSLFAIKIGLISCVTSQILDVSRVRRQLRPVRGMHRLRTVSPWTAPTGRCPWLGIAARARQRWACGPPLVVRAVARSAVASKSVRSGMGMANLLVRRLESPQADQTPTNRSFRDLILSSRCFALLKRAGLFGARPAARVAWPEWAAALGDAIKRAPAAGDPDDGSTFYRHWLASLERLVAEKGLASPEILDERRAAWDRAARDPARAADPAGQRPAERAP